ncbi:MAG: SOS response-associated peptidase [Acidobacteriota bacterium]|nr:SOS response-associated peptidase [Acidobacteriota bacterium]
MQSFAIITTDPSELTAMLHDRMPIILKPSDYDRWLTRDDPNARQWTTSGLTTPGRLNSFPVDHRVGNIGDNEPVLCEAYESPPNSA